MALPDPDPDPSMPERVAAFFDLDGTLLSVNSARLWLSSEWRSGRITSWQAARGGAFLLAYRAGLADIEYATREALMTVKGLPEELIRDRTIQWFDRDVARRSAPGAFPTIAAHRERGHAVVLLTSSSPYEAQAATRHFGLDATLSSTYEIENGRFTGEPVMPLCYGAGKVHFAQRWAQSAGIDVGSCFFYTDSYTDLPMLERVSNPRIINPDPRIARLARSRGWPILDWSSTSPTILAVPAPRRLDPSH